MKEPLNSKRLHVINSQIKDIHSEVTSLSDSLIDREAKEALGHIDNIKSKLNLLKDQVVNGNIVQKYKHK